ncbi:MAG: hypothetical protein ACJ79M_12485 [Myxococcales bacterium]
MTQTWMDPWLNLWSRLQGPLSGDVSQGFRILSPTIVNGQGDPRVEADIVENVVTYGKQLGQITDVLLELTTQTGLRESKALHELKSIAQKIEAKKQEHKASAFERALNALEHLAKADPDRYELLIAGLRPKQPDPASLG